RRPLRRRPRHPHRRRRLPHQAVRTRRPDLSRAAVCRCGGARMNPPTPSSHVQRLLRYVPGKPIEEVQREYGLDDIIKLASNENPLGPSPRAAAAIRTAAATVALYPDAACTRLVGALAKHWQVPPERVIAGNGSDEILHFLGLAYLRPGDEVLTCE